MVVTDALQTLLQSFTSTLPNAVGAVLILAVGVVIGFFVGRAARRVILSLKLDDHVSRGRKPLIRISDIFPKIFSWTIYIVSLQAAADFLGVVAFSTFIAGIIAFIPLLIKAIIIVVIGYVIAEYVRSELYRSDVEYSDIMSRVIYFIIIYISVAIALPLIGIDPFLVNAIMIIIIAAVAVGVAAALALSLRGVFEDTIKKYKAKKRLP